jgi:demethylspheroidene O-methyltransferase
MAFAAAHALKDRLLASPGFRRWAQSFPLTRPLARRRARALFDLCAGFVYAQVLTACVQLRLFDILAERPLAEPELARRLSLPPERLAPLVAAACSLRLVSRRGGKVALGPLGAAVIGNPGIEAMIGHHAALYADLADPVALLRGGADTRLGAYWPYATGAATSDAGVGAYTDLMAASLPMIADEVLAAYRLDRHQALLDVGGGSGGFLLAVAARAPRLKLMLFDLPQVAERARIRLAEAGVPVRVCGGSFLDDELPRGADVISLVRIVHDHDEPAARAILAAARRALPKGGTLLLAEPMAGTPGAESVGAYFSVYLLAMGSGRPRTAAEYTSLLGEAGFASVREARTRMPLMTRLLVARV